MMINTLKKKNVSYSQKNINKKIKRKIANLPKFDGEVFIRPPGYVQNVHAQDTPRDPYTVRAYQYATSSKPGFCMPAAVIYCRTDEDILKAIRYARENKIAIAVRTGGHHFWGFSSTSGNNIQIDLSQFRKFHYDAGAQTFTLGVGMQLQFVDDRLKNIGAFVPHGQCGTVCVGGHMQSGGFSVLGGRSFGWFTDHLVSFRLITADCRILTIRKPDPQNPNTENDSLWFSIIGGSPGNFGVVTEMTLKPLFDANHPDSRASTVYLPYSRDNLQKILQLLAKYNDDQDLPRDINVSAFVLGNNRLHPQKNIDTEVLAQNPDVAKGEADGYRPYAMGIWGIFTDVDGGGYNSYAKKFFKELQTLDTLGGRAVEFILGVANRLALDQKIPLLSPDKHTAMSDLTKYFGFPKRVQSNPYVSATWCATSTNLSNNGFAKWAADVTTEVYETPGTYADFEWVVTGGKHSQNVNGIKSNPSAIAWRDTSLLCFQYVHYDNTKHGKPWKQPEEFSLDWVDRARRGAIGPKGVLGPDDRRWNAFPVQDDSLDLAKKHYFQNEEVYQKVLATKRMIDPDNIFTANQFCVGASMVKLAK